MNGVKESIVTIVTGEVVVLTKEMHYVEEITVGVLVTGLFNSSVQNRQLALALRLVIGSPLVVLRVACHEDSDVARHDARYSVQSRCNNLLQLVFRQLTLGAEVVVSTTREPDGLIASSDLRTQSIFGLAVTR